MRLSTADQHHHRHPLSFLLLLFLSLSTRNQQPFLKKGGRCMLRGHASNLYIPFHKKNTGVECERKIERMLLCCCFCCLTTKEGKGDIPYGQSSQTTYSPLNTRLCVQPSLFS